MLALLAALAIEMLSVLAFFMLNIDRDFVFVPSDVLTFSAPGCA